MLIHPRGLSLITTKRCTAACDHCCFHCTPLATEAIPLERLHALVDEARDVPSIRLIVFTGGECFLLGQELDTLVARASDHGFATRCITNGYWASSLRVAMQRMRALAAAGLSEIEFSTGAFHAAYVPPRPRLCRNRLRPRPRC
jgi:MoaA/NifB/PqqE/SkfB family radical SAM enzyme